MVKENLGQTEKKKILNRDLFSNAQGEQVKVKWLLSRKECYAIYFVKSGERR